MVILQICRAIVSFPSLFLPVLPSAEPLMRAAAHIFRPLLVGKLREKFLGVWGLPPRAATQNFPKPLAFSDRNGYNRGEVQSRAADAAGKKGTLPYETAETSYRF